MSGRLEKERKIERQIEKRLVGTPPILQEYYYHLIGSGKSYETAYKYINYIIAFMGFTCGDKIDNKFYEKIKAVHINQYITSLRTIEVNGKTTRTSDSMRAVQWSALNAFFQFLVPERIKTNPVSQTIRPKMKDNPRVTYLTSEEILALLDNVAKIAPKRMKNRDLCILKLGFSTGLRVSAITQIDVSDIDFKNNQIRVTEKGDYDDYIMFGDNLRAQLLMWLQDRKEYYDEADTGALFVSRKGNRISKEAIGQMLTKYSEGITDKNVTPHVMRHSCATNLYEKTGDIYLCSKQLRHKNVTTTQRYAELSRTRQKDASNILDNLLV